jgi:hypothetical protein
MSEKKTTRTRCGNIKTATTWNFTSWMFCNSHNAFWHVEKCHDAKFMSWLLEKTTGTCSGIMEFPERVVVVSFYSHGTIWGKSYQTVEEGFSKWTVYRFSNVLMKNTCNIGIMKNSGIHLFLQELLEWHLEWHLIFFERHLHFLSVQCLLKLQLVNPCLLPDVVIEADRRDIEFEGTSCTSMKLLLAVVNSLRAYSHSSRPSFVPNR